MSTVIELNDAVYTKLERNAEVKGVTPEVWLEKIVDEEFKLANLQRFSDEERERMYRYSKDLDRRFANIMKGKRRKIMGRTEE